MHSLTAIVVDDEFLARENLKMLLEDYCPEIDIIGNAGNAEEAYQLVQELQPQVIFLDIRMPSGAEGFEFLESIPDKKFQVVFVTAFKDYALRAFQANAIHYVLKPIDIDDLRKAVDKLLSSNKQFEVDPSSFKAYISSLENLAKMVIESKPVTRITINHAKGFKIVDDADITYLEASGNCTHIHFIEGPAYLDTRTLKIYEELLDKDKFCRIHKSHIINLNFLKEYITEGGHFAILKDNTKLPVARNRLSQFLVVAKHGI